MIDWVTGKFWITHNPEVLRSGQSIRTKIVDGVETIEYDIANRLSVKGSHDATITIRSHTDNTVEISGNPAKFLQGHNVFGTNDLKYLVAKMIDKLCMIDELELKPTDVEYENIQQGIYHLSRVDVNEHFAFPSAQVARAWLRAAGNSANMKFRGAGLFKEGTLYFEGKRYIPKIYFKYDEINSKDKSHRLPDELLQIPELIEYAEKSLRFEIKILSTQLKDWMLHLGCNWDADTATMLINDQFISKLQLSANMPIENEVIESLPKNLRLTYTAWVNGEDLRQVLSRPTFYRYRTKLMEYGIDISIVKDIEKEQSNVVPMIRYLEAVPMGIPDWAYQKGLVA
ncbi:phage/plasmid replication protein, II/X family [Acinetobacter baumannii]|uniref:phage/plasmid replication protein, II/X family n=1 Tax=Acinetobacter baumannii TaxID=470 RepID=UPI001CDC8E49|nr:phage/plasmid replication protein, II/X family [Acinetobacter baumannii]MCA4238412.1 phage/plasmid replication protein, II/X family [Acinetobacter baumannii]MCA4260595.1 phage/plasmid replication protein, II/X family [Acinetobacter baumannii]